MSQDDSNAFGEVDKVEEPCPTSSSGQCQPGNETHPPTPRRGWLHRQNWKLKRLLGEKDAEIEKLKTLIVDKDAEIEVLTKNMNRMEAELVSEVEASGDLAVEMMELKLEAARKLKEKDVGTQELRKTLRRAEIDNYLLISGLKTAPMIQVLKIIVQNDRKDDGCIRWWNLLEIMMTCRLVCNSWRETVDLVMQQDSSHTDLCPGNLYLFEYKREHTPCPLKLSYKKFDKIRWMDNLKALSRERRKNSSFNPIPTRHFMIEPSIDHQGSDKWYKYSGMVRRFLQVLGVHVWHLTVNVFGVFSDESRDTAAVDKLVSEWLRLVPNLKSLALYTSMSRSPLEDGEEGLIFRKIPKFKDLITFQDWEKFLKVPWRLSELSLGCYGKTTVLAATSFFEGIKKFERTLTSLTYNLSKERWAGPEEQEAKLNLPRLKRLYLVSHDWEPLSLENILAPLECKNLETFSLKLSQTYDSWQFSEITPFVNYVNNFSCRHSDWMKFPKLRNVKLTVNVNSFEMDDRRFHKVRRSNVNMPSVRFDVVEMHECHIWYWDQ